MGAFLEEEEEEEAATGQEGGGGGERRRDSERWRRMRREAAGYVEGETGEGEEQQGEATPSQLPLLQCVCTLPCYVLLLFSCDAGSRHLLGTRTRIPCWCNTDNTDNTILTLRHCVVVLQLLVSRDEARPHRLHLLLLLLLLVMRVLRVMRAPHAVWLQRRASLQVCVASLHLH